MVISAQLPSLARVLNPQVNLASYPVTPEERIFVTFLILHLHNSFQAERFKMFHAPAGIATDIAEFFRLPIPSGVWEEVKKFQDPDFVEFVEAARQK